MATTLQTRKMGIHWLRRKIRASREAAVSVWPEVKHINGYVMLLVTLSMAVRGLGFLVLTWTTVVLLGGFVSNLTEEDFWCLTVITFVQIAGVVYVYMDERMTSLGWSGAGLDSVNYVFARNRLSGTRGVVRLITLVKQVLGYIAFCVQVLVAMIVLWGFGFGLLQLGLLVAAGLSLWRLIHHDYGATDGGGSKANMNPALSVLYILVVVQFATLAYKKIILLSVGRRTVDRTAEIYGFTGEEQAIASVSDYYHYIMKGCSKDPTFATGKNLITYAVYLMEPSNSPKEYQSGTRILGTLLRCCMDRKKFDGQCRLIKQLVGSSSSSHIIQKLLQMLDSRSHPYDREVRDCAARVVALVADEIRLEQFPRELQCISSLIETFQDWYVRDWYQQGRRQSSESSSDDPDLRNDYINLLDHGMRIFHHLASDENNCTVISKTQGLLSKIMAPVTCDLLHRIDHTAWINIVKLSLMVMSLLVAAPGETGDKVLEEISRNKEAIGSMERILSCDKCEKGDGLHIQVVKILTQLYMHTQGVEINFIKMLVGIFTGEDKDISSRKMAGESLAKLSLNSESSVGFILKAEDDVADRLSRMLLDVGNKTYRTSVAEILQNLCINCTNDDECFRKLKKAITDAMPKMLQEILLCCGLEKDQTNAGATQPGQNSLAEPGTDIEKGSPFRLGFCCGLKKDNDQQNNSSSSHQQKNEQVEDKNYDEEFNATLFFLYVTVYDKLISTDQDLAHQFYGNAPANGAPSFPRKLKDMVEKMRHPRPTCLRMLKLISTMVISMMKNRGRYLKKDLYSLIESLSTASKDMFLLDGSMILVCGDRGGMITKPLGSLVSLVEEAQELVEKY